MKNKGFTLIEMLLAIVLLGIAVTFVVLSFGKLNAEQALDTSVESAVSVFSEARSMTLSSVNDSQYGVHLESAQVVLFKGSSYSSSDSANVPTTLNSQVALRNITLSGGGSDVVFNRLTGATAKTGTFELYLKSATTTYKTLTVGATGLVEPN
jgi:prepilin-type N-terminal cleavage/methylation domain-containing protein